MATISQDLVADLGKTINSFGVPCVLWGHCLLNIHGVPSIIASIDFVVPDEQLQTSIDAVSTDNRNLATCSKLDICPVESKHRCTPAPAFHMHLHDDVDLAVGLYRQSETLWFLPPLAKVLPNTPDELVANSIFTTASDSVALPPWRPGRGSGVFTDQDCHPVVVPRADVLLEAYMRLYARDSGKQVGSFSMAMISYMEQYVDEDGFSDTASLSEPLKWFYQQLKAGEMPVRQWTKELREALGVGS